MKKTLVAAAILGSFAASAFAAPSVTLYGKIDTGFLYSHVDADQAGVDSVDKFEMKSGWNSGSRWGLKGTEDIGNAKVGFQLESGFNSDDGTSAQGGRLFGRQATVSVSGAYGTVYAGRLGSVSSDMGSVGMLGGVSPFGSSFTDLGTHGSTGSAWARYDNAIAYASPMIAGFYANAMYSFKADSKSVKEVKAAENKPEATRYAAAGLGYKNGALDAVLVFDYTLYGNDTTHLGNGWSVILGGNYDFGVAKAFAKATYFDNQTDAEDVFHFPVDADSHKLFNLKGWGASLGASVPVFGGNFMAEVGYRDSEDVEYHNIDFKRWNTTVGYNYALSKRTSVYATGGWVQEKLDAAAKIKVNRVLVGGGLIHNF